MTHIRAFAIIAIFACGCANNHDPPCYSDLELNGTLIATAGLGRLRVTTFPGQEVHFIEHSERFNYGTYFEPGPSGKLFGSIGGTVSGSSSITEIDIRTGEMRVLRDGSWAVWEPLSDSLVFWHGQSGNSADQRLFFADRFSPETAVEVCGVPAPVEYQHGTEYYFLSPPVVLGQGLVASFNEQREVCILDTTTGEFKELGIKDCWPQAARGDGRRFFCTDIHTWNVFELDLVASSKTALPGMVGTGYLFIEGMNSLLFSEPEGQLFPIPHEQVTTKVYSIEKQTACTVESPVSISEGVVWLSS